jgi:hypothetical protein
LGDTDCTPLNFQRTTKRIFYEKDILIVRTFISKSSSSLNLFAARVLRYPIWGVTLLGASISISAVASDLSGQKNIMPVGGMGSGPISLSLLDFARMQRPVRGTDPGLARSAEPVSEMLVAQRRSEAPPAANRQQATTSSAKSALMFASFSDDGSGAGASCLPARMQQTFKN